MAWLDDHPPARSQFRRPRRDDPSGVVVVHTAENTPDLVAFDGGAEAVARYIAGRPDPGSYHDVCDSDSAINLVGYDAEAYHDATGSNPHSYGVSIATRADVWPLAPQAWRDGAIVQAAAAAARYAAWLRARSGIVIPARRITRAESDRRIPGFIAHAERDPARRSDPGAAFPWDTFLATYDQLTRTPRSVDMAFPVIRVANDPDRTAWLALTPQGAVPVPTPEYADVGVAVGLFAPVQTVNARAWDVARDMANRLDPEHAGAHDVMVWYAAVGERGETTPLHRIIRQALDQRPAG